ncbi:Phage protein [Staphylococcus phage phiSA039]|nr:Phage protein [Staphylococcus phage phiSA039]
MINATHARYLSEIYEDEISYETVNSIVEDVLDNINDSIIDEATKGNTTYQYVLRDLRVDKEVEDRVIDELTKLGYKVKYISNSIEYPSISTNNLIGIDYLSIKW